MIPWLLFHVIFPTFLCFFAMSAPPPPISVPASFLDPDGISSLKALSDASIISPPDALVSLLIAEGSLSVTQLQGQYGFMLTAKLASKFGPPERNHLSVVPEVITNPADLEFHNRNDPILPWEACTTMIPTEDVSGIIVVVRHWNSLSSKYGSPTLRLVAAPYLETFPTASMEPAVRSSCISVIPSRNPWPILG